MSRDRELAAGKFAGKESASDRKTRKETEASTKRRHSYRHGGATRADRAGWAWSDKQP